MRTNPENCSGVSPDVSAVILAAGRGLRFKSPTNKIYADLIGRPLLAYSLNWFTESDLVDEIVLVVSKGEEMATRALIRDWSLSARIICGGERRQDSSLAGVETAQGAIVLIHDAVRPFIVPALIKRVVEGTRKYKATVPVLPEVNTIRHRNRDGFLCATMIDRTDLVQIQTPQGFDRNLICHALQEANQCGVDLSDDAAALLRLGKPVFTVPGNHMNMKITTQEDLDLAVLWARQLEKESFIPNNMF